MPRVIKSSEMLRQGTPVEDYHDLYGFWVKREDLACFPPGPPFSKTRGVFSHVASRPERIIGVLDTFHSQAGHAVARACQILGKSCVNFYPVYKSDNWALRAPQIAAQDLGARLVGLPAGRSCILYHAAKKQIAQLGGYMMPNALKLPESVTETAKECASLPPNLRRVIIPASSGTIAAGVVKGVGSGVEYLIHLGYDRSPEQVSRYIREASGVSDAKLTIVSEGYVYKDIARPGTTPPWPCNPYYDLKAFRWYLNSKYPTDEVPPESVLFWNIG
jgi:hypothetical protein